MDLYAIGDGPAYRLERAGGRLVSVSWRTHEAELGSFAQPWRAGAVIPAWRNAVVLHDGSGVAAELASAAAEWGWEQIDAECDAWVTDEVTGYAEEVHKLHAALERGDDLDAVVQRSVLALRLPRALSVHHRLLYETDHDLWRLVAERMGDGWRAAHAASLGLGAEPVGESSRAALRLFVLAADAVEPLFDARQRAVVTAAREACIVAGATKSLCIDTGNHMATQLRDTVLNDDVRAFLDEVMPVILGTTRSDGTVQMNPVWYERRDGEIWLNAATSRAWRKRLEVGDGVTLLFIDPANMWRWAQVQGVVSDMGTDGGEDHIDRLSRRYLGRDYSDHRPEDPRVILKVRPTRVTGSFTE